MQSKTKIIVAGACVCLIATGIIGLSLVGGINSKSTDNSHRVANSRIPSGEVAADHVKMTQPEQIGRNHLPSRLTELIARLKKTGVKEDQILAEAILLAWGDFGAGLEYLMQALSPRDQNRYLEALFIAIFSERLTGFEKYAFQIEDPSSKSRVIGVVIDHWAAADPLYLANYALSFLDDATRQAVLNTVIHTLSRAGQNDDALRLLRELPVSRERDSALSAIAVSWGTRDVAGAIGWAETLESSDERRAVIPKVIGNAAAKMSPEMILGYANTATDEFTRKIWVSAATTAILKEDVGRAKQWAEELPDEYRDSAKAKVAGKMAADSPEQAAAYVDGIVNSNSRAHSIDLMLLAIGPDRQKIEKWFDALPSDLQERAASGAVMSMFQRDSRSAVQWAEQLPQGAAKDRANFTLVSLFKDAAPERIAAASQIVDATLREYAKKMLAGKN